MSVEEVVKVLKAVPSATRYSQEQQWVNACQEYGLDPKSEALQHYVYGAVQGGRKPLKEAMEAAKEFFATKPKAEASGASVETEPSVTGGTANLFRAKDAAHAAQLASKGVAIPTKRSDELVRESLERRLKSATGG